jgi:NAD(P)-dependent dehydrogenase (short-subunit alcohol dehydrogenase family)
LTIHSGAGLKSGANLRVLVTGAGGGIGYACARAFAEKGAELILSDIDGHALELASTSLGALGRFCDVASEASVAIFAADILRSHSSIDVLINAAGAGYVRNLGTMRITRAFLPMMKSDGGKKDVVNIASMGRPLMREGSRFPYAASREAFDRLSEALIENIRGTKVALTTVVPRMLPGMPSVDETLAIGDVQHFERYDADRVAAAVIEAVQSDKSVPGEAISLTGPLAPKMPDKQPDAFPDEARLRGRRH